MSAGHQDGGGVKDTGWAWMTVIAGFIMHFLVVGGAAKSFGILYVELVEKFQTSSSATLSIVAMSQSLCMLLGPIANALALRFTSRRTVMLGGLLMSSGFILSMFPPNIGYLYFSYGLLVGVGSSLAYSPTIVTVGQYFSKRRALANGLSVAGSGLGNFFVPALIRATLDRYGFGGAMLIMAGLMLNVCLAGALLRPVVPSRPPPAATLAVEEPTRNSASIEQSTKSEDVEQVQLKNENELQRDEMTSTSGCCRASPTFGVCAACLRLFDWNLLANPLFLVYAFASMLLFTGYPPLYIMLPDHAVRSSVGASKSAATLLLSILGLSDVVGRISFGILADLNLVPKRFLFAGCMSIAGSLICVLPHVGSYVGLAVTCGVVGLFVGAFFTLLMVVLAEKFGVHRLHAAFGMVATFMGTSFFYSAPIVGTLRDLTGSWTASFTFSGVSMLCGSALLLLDPLAVRYQEIRERRRLSMADNTQQQ